MDSMDPCVPPQEAIYMGVGAKEGGLTVTKSAGQSAECIGGYGWAKE